MTRRVCLVAPSHTHIPGPFESFARFAEPPLGLAYLAAAIRAAGLDVTVDVVDGLASADTPEALARKVIGMRPDMVGFSTVTPTAPAVREICRSVKAALPTCRTVVGGPHPTALPTDLFPEADVAVIGEGEETLVEVLSRRTQETVRGIAFRTEGGSVVNPPRRLVADLDDLAPPAYDLLPLDRYRYPYPLRRSRGRYATAITSRGCPGRCTFCAKTKLWGRRVRFHSIERVMADLSMLVEDHGVSLLYFYDDTLLSDRGRALALCEAIRRTRRPLRWICQGRADEVDSEICEALADGGCVKMEIGVECGDATVLEDVGKGIELDRVKEVFDTPKRVGIQTKANFMLGFPGETKETIRKTISLAMRIDATYVNFFLLVPFPGSALFEKYRRKGWLLTSDWARFSYHDSAIVSVPGASAEALDRAKREGLRRFYLRPAKLAQIVVLALRSGDVSTFLRGILGFLNGLVEPRVHKKA